MGFIQNIFGVENRSANETPEINTSSFESKEGVQEPKSNTDENNNNLLEFYNGYISVGKDNIRQEPTYKQAVDIVSSAIASCPIYLYKEGKDGKIERMYGDYRENILNGEVNDFMSSYEFKKKYSADVYEYGNGNALIQRDGNTITKLLYAENSLVSECKEKNEYGIVDKIIYRANGKVIDDEMLLVTKNGDGAYKTCRNEVENYINLVNQEGSLILNMARPSGILETDGRLNSNTATKLKKAWENLYSGVKNAGKTVVLEEGLKFKPLSQQEMISNKEAKDVIEKMIEKGCNIPVGYITGGNITSELKNEFYNRVLKPIMSAMIDEFNRSLLLLNKNPRIVRGSQ